MSLPSGVATKQLSIHPGSSPFGEDMSVEVSITLTPPLIIWEATGQPIFSFYRTKRSRIGEPLVVTLPVVDQAGFVDEQNEPITGWQYNVVVKYLLGAAKRKVGVQRTRIFQPLSSDENVAWFLDD